MLLYVYLLCQVTFIRLGITCGGIGLVCICVGGISIVSDICIRSNQLIDSFAWSFHV